MAQPRTPTAKSAAASADHRVILLHGKEHFRIAEATKRIEDSLRDRFGDIDIFMFDGTTADLASILDELRSYSLMQTHKLVILDNADAFLVEKKDEDEQEDKKPASPRKSGSKRKTEGSLNRRALERYAENPVDHATLLLRAEGWRPGTLDKIIQKRGAILQFKEETDASATAFCTQRARDEYGVTLDRAAAALLVERLGTSLTRLDSEIAKLASLVEAGAAITEEHIRQVVGKSREEQAWDIQEAVLTGSRGAALTKVNELLEISQAPRELIMWSLIDLIRKLHTASAMLSQGASPGEASKQARMWGPSAGPMVQAARKQSPHQLAALLHRAVQMDAQSKTGLASAERTLEGLAILLADTLK